MNPRGLRLGLYRLYWHSGGSSLASVGQLADGSPWFAPINWTSKTPAGIASTKWEVIERAEAIPVDDACDGAPLPGEEPAPQRRGRRPGKRWDLCPVALHADDCDCRGAGGDR